MTTAYPTIDKTHDDDPITKFLLRQRNSPIDEWLNQNEIPEDR